VERWFVVSMLLPFFPRKMCRTRLPFWPCREKKTHPSFLLSFPLADASEAAPRCIYQASMKYVLVSGGEKRQRPMASCSWTNGMFRCDQRSRQGHYRYEHTAAFGPACAPTLTSVQASSTGLLLKTMGLKICLTRHKGPPFIQANKDARLVHQDRSLSQCRCRHHEPQGVCCPPPPPQDSRL
jgi:hypothetical protein